MDKVYVVYKADISEDEYGDDVVDISAMKVFKNEIDAKLYGSILKSKLLSYESDEHVRIKEVAFDEGL
jgi:hypothetical protein